MTTPCEHRDAAASRAAGERRAVERNMDLRLILCGLAARYNPANLCDGESSQNGVKW
jgi:hypothetical protein